MKLGLALGGGGARGAAHIGFLMEMERLGLEPDVIVGTSAGGIVGAMVATGMPLEEVAETFRRASLTRLFTLPGGKPGLTDAEKTAELLESLIGRPTFTELELEFAVVTVDLVDRRMVILDEGDVISAVLATAAFPILTAPVQRDGLTLVDGGILNNVPFDIVRARGASYVIALDLSRSSPYGSAPEVTTPTSGLLARAISATQRHPMWQVAAVVSDILTSQGVRARMAIAPPDLHIQPEVGTIGILDFHRTNEGILAGKKAATKVEATLRELAAQQAAFRHESRGGT